jgi:hypothetical protein
MKLLLTVIFVAVITLRHAAAQTIPYDSAKIMRTARRDARRFKLNSGDRKKFRVQNFPSMSDHFKPTAAGISRPDLLNDSLYVQTYRDAAFYNTAMRMNPSVRDILMHPPGRGYYEPRYSSSNEKTAGKDAQYFKLDKKTMKKFKAGNFPSTSDYFKPTAYYASDAALLNDSLYVKAFRQVAFYRVLHKSMQHPVLGLAIAGVSVVGGIVLFFEFLHLLKII